MKKQFTPLLVIAAIVITCYSCKDFLNQPAKAALNEEALANKKGVEGLLIGAYSVLDGFINGAGIFLGGWEAAGSNWIYGSVVGGDANKGSDAGDQSDMNPIGRYEQTANNAYFNVKWRVVYEGVARTNNTIRVLAKADDISDADRKRILGEARFLRGHYHFEAKKMWNNVPYVDENVTDFKIGNETDIWPMIEADLKHAYDNLPELQNEIGRANKWAAGALYAKALLFQKKYSEARTVLNAVIANGRNPKGVKYALLTKFQDNFNAETKNSAESVFAIQYSVNDGAVDAANGGWGDVLNFPHTGGPGGCCGFFQPSQDFVNSYKTVAGLPEFDNYNATEVTNDQGLASGSPGYVEYAGTLDPRLDWTVGRRGIPYLDWGNHPGANWIRDQVYGGPYSPKKNTYYKSQTNRYTDASFWTSGVTANNYTLIRFADVLLMAAEAEVEIGDLNVARGYVNQIRARAANPQSFVFNYIDDANPALGFSAVPAANYVLAQYTAPWADKNYARKAVQFERKLELGMEGHRFFDLVRWGIAAPTLNAYLAYERTKRNSFIGASFTAGKNEYFPIPQRQIDLSTTGGVPALKQNPGY